MFRDAVRHPTPSRPLRADCLTRPGSGLGAPAFDRSRLRPAVAHIGVGYFHRAHQAAFFHDLAARGLADWGIRGIGLRAGSQAADLGRQDFLYTLRECGERERTRVIGSLLDFVDAVRRPADALAAVADPACKLVTLTVTGGGYKVDLQARELLEDDPDVRGDLESPARPRTVPGFLVEALRARRRAGVAPPTVISCDNVPRNGEVVRTAVVSFARLRDPDLAKWIDSAVAFPSTVVDRITPGTSPEARRTVMDRYGIWDASPVVAEGFRQWTIEDRFCNERPPLDAVGAEFVAGVGEHELVKKRLLNGGHTALCYLAVLCGHDRVDEAMADPCIHAFATGMMDEVMPLLPQPDGVDLAAYAASLRERFANPGVADRLARLCARGSVKMPSYLLPSLHEAIEAGAPHDALTLAVAAWMRYLRGPDFDGREITVDDPRATRLTRVARGARGNPGRLLAQREIFGDLAENEQFADDLTAALAKLDRDGPRAAAMTVARGASLAAA